MTETISVELFDADGTNPRIRWARNGTPPVERRLDRAEVDRLVGLAQEYRVDPLPGSELQRIGGALYGWLDGPNERWLARARADEEPIVLYLTGEERLRAVPWEALHEGGFLCVDPFRPLIPVRSASVRGATASPPAGNRPLRVLFMATSPTDVQPVLDFEAEEAEILQASPGLVEVVVEESGTLSGLSQTASRPREPFDVIHLSGHGTLTSDGPRFVMEDDTGLAQLASADDIAQALNRHWPRLLFVSGCWTGDATDAGLVESLAEALVRAGAPAVLGWGLPVGDMAASSLAAALYQALGRGESLAEAVAIARRALFTQPSREWHLLRLFADRTPLARLVTAPGNPGRTLLQIRPAQSLFLDPEGQVRVATQESFVGRRRDLQTLLRDLRPANPTSGPQGAVIHGMGGLGKSSLTSRLLERMRPTHPLRAVWTGKIDATEITTKLADQLNLDRDTDLTVKQLLNTDGASLADKLRYILQQPLADASHQCVFVFDDFENGNLDPDGQGGHQLGPEALDVLTAFATAINRSGSSSRIVVTSRYNFHRSGSIRLTQLPIAELQGTDLKKMLRGTRHLGPLSTLDPTLKQTAITAAAGIPRLINGIDDLINADAATADLLSAIERTQVEYRDQLVLQALLDAQPEGVRRLLALASVYRIAVPLDAIRALHPDADTDIAAAVNSGLLQAGIHPATNETRYLVSPLLHPLLLETTEYPTADQFVATQALAARALSTLWLDDAQ